MTLLVVLAVTVAAVLGTRQLVSDQEQRLLAGRTREVRATLAGSVSALPPSLTTLGGVLAATGGSPRAFARVATEELPSEPGTSYAWLRPSGSGYTVLSAAGPAFTVGQVLAGPAATAAGAALAGGGLWATSVIGSGTGRSIGFAYGAPAAPAGTVVYRQAPLGPLESPQAASAPFRELDVVLYASAAPVSAQALVSTAASLPLTGRVVRQPLPVGHSTWLVAARATGPLVGSVAADAEWAVLAGGLLLALVATVAAETEGRRRDVAVALYAGEHRMAEALQRSLLPAVPDLADLDVAARYQAGGRGQQVGGDWFDVFPLDGGRVAVVIGDVMGHDPEAAASMAQVRASLRAFAWEGRSPAAVLVDLDRLVDTFALAPLVTAFFGVLEPAGADGGRLLRYSNAGHLPPFLRHPGGRVQRVTGASGVLIGAVPGIARPEATVVVPAGAVLVCCTDGLVERPGRSIDDGLAAVEAVVAATTGGAEATCAALVAAAGADLRDDVAVVAVGTDPAPEVAAAAVGARAG